MAWIRTIEPDEATGELRHEYDNAIDRAGRVFNILKVMGLNPKHLRSSIDLYLGIMHGPSQLSRAQRDMLAVVVSRANPVTIESSRTQLTSGPRSQTSASSSDSRWTERPQLSARRTRHSLISQRN